MPPRTAIHKPPFAAGAVRTTIWLAALLGQDVLRFLVPRPSWLHLLSSYHLVPGHFIERLSLHSLTPHARCAQRGDAIASGLRRCHT